MLFFRNDQTYLPIKSAEEVIGNLFFFYFER